MNNKFIIKYIPKKNGYRKIVMYGKSQESIELKNFHEKANSIIIKNTIPSKFAKAYIKDRSIIKNAKCHMYNDIFVMIDIKDFFSSINHNRMIKYLWRELKLSIPNVSKRDCANIVKSSSITNKGLATGLKLSPILSNIYLKSFDNIAYGKIRRCNIENPIYTRYADDITISFKECENYKEEIYKIIKIISDALKNIGLKINDKKTKVYFIKSCNRVRITGINIIKYECGIRKLSVGRKRKNKLFWDTVKYCEDLDNGNRNISELKKIKGMLSFILSVEGKYFENIYSQNMKIKLLDRGFNSLKELIDSLE